MKGLAADIGLTRDGFTLGVALGIDPGEVVALVGPNGAGKSTVIDAIAGLQPLDSGRITVDDVVYDEPNTKTFLAASARSVGVVFQDHALFPHLSAVDNAAFGLRARGESKAEARDTASEWLDRLGVGDRAGHRPAELSGGESQRIALARALAPKPSVLLLDEPFAALDASTRIEIRRLLDDTLADQDAATLLVTHDPADAFLLADSVHVIEDGSIVQGGTATEIRLQPQTRYVADLVGVNLLEGTASKGRLVVGGHALTIADTGISGPVLARIHPRAISIHRMRPEGSPRNTWETTVIRDERYGDRVRLQMGIPIEITAEITPTAEEALGIEEGSVVWVSVKATEIDVQPR